MGPGTNFRSWNQGPGTNFRVLMDAVSALFGMPDE